jgi:hypothetical protein
MAGTVNLDSVLLKQLSFALQSGIKLYKTVENTQTQSHSALDLLLVHLVLGAFHSGLEIRRYTGCEAV